MIRICNLFVSFRDLIDTEKARMFNVDEVSNGDRAITDSRTTSERGVIPKSEHFKSGNPRFLSQPLIKLSIFKGRRFQQ